MQLISFQLAKTSNFLDTFKTTRINDRTEEESRGHGEHMSCIGRIGIFWKRKDQTPSSDAIERVGLDQGHTHFTWFGSQLIFLKDARRMYVDFVYDEVWLLWIDGGECDDHIHIDNDL